MYVCDIYGTALGLNSSGVIKIRGLDFVMARAYTLEEFNQHMVKVE